MEVWKMKNYKIVFKNHLLHVFPMVIIVLITLAIGYYMSIINYGTPPYSIYTIWLGFHIVPTAFLHLNYLLVNNRSTVQYESTTRNVQFTSKTDKVSFFLEEIKYARVVKSFALNKGNMQLLSWDSYNHMIIELENGTQIVLTSLLMGIHNPLPIPEEKITVEMNLFRWVNRKGIRFPK
jgi:hypothetical protein